MSEPEKSEQNPYESPLGAEPLTERKAAKSGIKMTDIVLLTPIAGFIVGWISHTAKMVYLHALDHQKPVVSETVLTCLVFAPPTITVIGMIVWAIRAQLCESAEDRIRWAEEQTARKAQLDRGA